MHPHGIEYVQDESLVLHCTGQGQRIFVFVGYIFVVRGGNPM
jgi:hypothetical protein